MGAVGVALADETARRGGVGVETAAADEVTGQPREKAVPAAVNRVDRAAGDAVANWPRPDCFRGCLLRTMLWGGEKADAADADKATKRTAET